MASKNPPVKNAAFTFRISLFAQEDNQIKSSPTIAAGDFKICTDGGALTNPATLPSESPSGSGLVLISLSAAEMNGDEVVVRWLDAAGDEWHSGSLTMHTVASGQQFDDLNSTTPPTAAANADAVWEEALADHSGTSGSTAEAVSNIPGVTAGAVEYTYTIDDGTDPVEGVEIWIATDSAGSNVIWSGVTDAFGIARASDNQKPWLDAGTYYGWAQKGGYSFANPDTLSVS